MFDKFWKVHLKGKVVFSLTYGLHRFQIQFHLQIEISSCNFNLHMYMIYITWISNSISFANWICNLRFQIAISICNWNWLLGKFWQVHLKGKVFFSLWYGLHHFQIQFHLQIAIAIWNFNLHMCSYTIHKFGANFGKFTITNLSQLYQISPN